MIGIDEVGRGCIWGDLVVAGVANVNCWSHPDVKDSKEFGSSPSAHRQRAELRRQIEIHCLTTVATLDAKTIDRCGISDCLKVLVNRVARAMVDAAGRQPLQIVMDGQDFASGLESKWPHVAFKCIPKADRDVFEVGAASIVAKAYRDQWVLDTAASDPSLERYDIARNKGYMTAKHTAALKVHGLLPDHRATFNLERLVPQ